MVALNSEANPAAIAANDVAGTVLQVAAPVICLIMLASIPRRCRMLVAASAGVVVSVRVAAMVPWGSC